jgi:hypothetical protein
MGHFNVVVAALVLALVRGLLVIPYNHLSYHKYFGPLTFIDLQKIFEIVFFQYFYQ